MKTTGEQNIEIMIPQLFCFSHAGGTAEFFDEIGKDLPQVELVKIEYAGHGVRRKEPFYADYSELTKDVIRIVESNYRGDSYGLFGYSMGAITLVEILKQIIQEGCIPVPKHVFLAAHEPHTKKELQGFSSEELDDWVKQRTIRFGDIPETLIDNRPFWRTYLPVYRADYSLISSYSFERLNLQTSIAATVFYSETDTPYEDMKGWKDYFQGECVFQKYDGNHFFIRNHHQEMADLIRDGLNA